MPWQSVPPMLIITAAFGAIGGGLIGVDYLFLGRVRVWWGITASRRLHTYDTSNTDSPIFGYLFLHSTLIKNKAAKNYAWWLFICIGETWRGCNGIS